eukprot:gb/GECH01003619.1/.p1 GENE.gb/GECH01003619.1/~~gb/GECH01003619.1/.p1  ORF type:complete len:398 (+),score=110.71 gb/GECH01003619.1/:1-1194(+)
MGLRKWLMAGNSANQNVDLKGKLCLITGASSGIGLETTAALVSMGAKVIMAVRNTEKGENVKKEIAERIGNDSLDRMEIMHLDLNDLENVRKFTDSFKEKYDTLDILINNAACFVSFDSGQKTEQGYEKMFGVNHLGPFLLTWKLLDLLKNASDQPRIVNVASDAQSFVKESNFRDIHRLHELPDVEPNQGSASSSFGRYAVTKLCNILFTRKLDQILNHGDNSSSSSSLNSRRSFEREKERDDPCLDYPDFHNSQEIPSGKISDEDRPLQVWFTGVLLCPCLIGLSCLLGPRSYYFSFNNDQRKFWYDTHRGLLGFKWHREEKTIPYDRIRCFIEVYIHHAGDPDDQYVYFVTKSGSQFHLKHFSDPKDEAAPRFMKRMSNFTGIPIKWHPYAGNS